MKKILIGLASSCNPCFPDGGFGAILGHGGYGGYGGYSRSYERHDHDGAGLAIGAGVLGLVAGAALASSHRDYDDRGYGYGYGRCFYQSRPVYDVYGDVEYQQVRVCR